MAFEIKAELRGFQYRYIKNCLDSRMEIKFHIGNHLFQQRFRSFQIHRRVNVKKSQ